MAVFSFDVEVSTHDLLKEGVLARRLFGSQHTHHRVVVEAEDVIAAEILAAQMAIATCGYVTRLSLRI